MTAPRIANSPRHHPYMSPDKAYTPSLASSLQSYRSTFSSSQQQQRQQHGDAVERADNTTSINDNMNRHPW